MDVRIRITSTPPSWIAPIEVRQAWVGLEMPAQPDIDEDEWTGKDSVVGYLVSKIDAVEALLGARKKFASDFWLSMTPINQFRFDANCCEVIGERTDIHNPTEGRMK